MQTLIALFNRAQGLRTYLTVATAALFFIGGLLGLIPDAASVKLGGMFVAAAVACFRLSLANSDQIFEQKLSTLESVITGKPDPNPPTAEELHQLANDAAARAAQSLGITLDQYREVLQQKLQIYSPPVDETKATKAA